RPLAANYWHADLMISLHNNIGVGSGTLTLYDTANGFRDESRRLANLLQDNVVQTIRGELTSRWRSQGVIGSEARYGENHWTQMPSALVEIGFIDHPWDRRWIGSIEFREVVGKAIAKAVCEYFRVPLPPGEGPLPLDYATPVVGARPASPPVILCLGEHKAGDAQRYASLLRAQVEARFGSGIYQVESAEGKTLVELLSRWNTLVVRQRPSIVLIALGTAELQGAQSGETEAALARFQANLTETVRRVRALCAVPVLTLIQPDAGAGEVICDRYNDVIRRVARKTYSQVTMIHALDHTTNGKWFVPASMSAAQKRRILAAARMNAAVLFLEALPTVSRMR
ncbi:MAG TPA: N-acetylmuramoyl-L-alanine amidase, partial [Armatimonadota bacterium]|nr:N-acetylmuramoyl-L-alanine amidase [Armatimonadota bacterium]